jgi:hypothetical protein
MVRVPILSLSIVVSALGCSGAGEQRGTAATTVGSTAVASDVKTDNACQLLTKAEAATVLSSSIKKVGDESAPEPLGTMLRSSCFYRAEDGGTVQLTVNSFQTESEADEKYGALKSMYRGARPAAGVGEEAFAQNETLVVKQGSRYLTVELHPVGAKALTDYSNAQQMDALLAVERQVATQAIGRLPQAATTVATTGGSAKSMCSMMSKEEMEGVLGGSLTHAVPTDSPDKTVCTYTGAGGRYAQVSIEWQGGETGMAASRLAGALMGNNSDVKATTKVEGVGDEAELLAGPVLNVRKGAALIIVDLRGQENGEARATAIAQKVLARI